MTVHRSPEDRSYDFSTGRGKGATRTDRWAVRQLRASQALGGTLARTDDFWRYAEAIAEGECTADDLAVEYVPRESPPRRAVAKLLTIGSENVERRFARDGIRAGAGVLAVTTASGRLAYFEDDQSLRANAFSDDGIRILDLGAVLVARRGGHRCLECGEVLEETRRTYQRGDGQVSERLNYCEPCRAAEDEYGLTLAKRIDLGPEFGDITGQHFRAINKVLTEAADQILGPHPAGWISGR